MMQRNWTRREMLRMGLAGAAGAVLGARGLAAAEKSKRIPVGLQLYSVRRECGKDKGKNFPSVVEQVAKMGYEGVEFAGYYGHDAKAVRKVLDDNGLTACGTHTGFGGIRGDALKRTIEFHQAIGCRFIIVPGMPKKYMSSADGAKEAAEIFNAAAETLKPLKMHCGYHNHSHEFKPLDGGGTPWEVFFDNTAKEVVMQIDTGNCMGGKGDPVKYLKKYPGRALTVHCKEHGGGRDAVVGEGDCPWKEIIPLGRTTAGTQWWVIEHERGGDAIENVRRCLVNFRKLQKEVG